MNNQNKIPDVRNWPFAREIQEYSSPVFPVRHSGSFSIRNGFPDPDRLLDSACDTVKRYLRAAGYSETDPADYTIADYQMVPSNP